MNINENKMTVNTKISKSKLSFGLVMSISVNFLEMVKIFIFHN